MNKRLLLFTTIVFVLFVFPVSSDAQGFLKKIGNALSKVEKALSDGGKSSSATTKNFVNMPGVTFNVREIYRVGTCVAISFDISNASKNVYDITFNGTDGLDGWLKCQATGGDGKSRSCYVSNVGDKTSMDMVVRYRLMPGATAQGIFMINNVGSSVCQINSFVVGGLWQANEDNNNHNFGFALNKPVAIAEASASASSSNTAQIDADFVKFFNLFASNLKFQQTRIKFPLQASNDDNDFIYRSVSELGGTVIYADEWPEAKPKATVSGNTAKVEYINAVSGEQNLQYDFKKLNGKWYLVSLYSQSK